MMMPTGGRVPPERYPWWVKFSLLGAQSRTSQWYWVAASLGAAVLCLVLAATDHSIYRVVLALAGMWGLVAAAMYWLTIRWMDRHGTWR